MYITKIGLTDFRNYRTFDLEPRRELTVLVGPNAAGKTNIIEAVEIVATGRSFRNPQWAEVVRWGSSSTSLSMKAEGASSHADVLLSIDGAGVRSWRSSGVVKRRQVDATRFVPVVIFTPDDLTLIKGSAERRRTAIDLLGDQLSVTYASLRREYARVVRQRNAALKSGADSRLIAPWDEQLVALGARLHIHRRRLVERVAQAAIATYGHLAAGEQLKMVLDDRCGVGAECPTDDLTQESVSSALQRELERKRGDERARSVSLVGPHRDDIVFTIDGRSARSYASQGQQRTIALAWKIAEVTVVRELLGKTPVLLLDDVMSELDSARRHALTDLVQQDVQTFMTTTNTGYFEPALLDSALVVRVGVE